MHKGWLLPLSIAALATASAPPGAAAQPRQNEAIAEALFRDGRDLLKAGRVHEACEKFAASLVLDPALGTLLNLASCHEKEGRFASAWTEFSEVAAKASQQGQKDRETYARSRMAVLESKLVRARISVAQPVPAQEIRLDGKVLPRAAWDVAMPLDPGTYPVQASATGYQPWTGSLVVPASGEGPRLEVPALAREPSDPSEMLVPAPPVSRIPTKPPAGEPVPAVAVAPPPLIAPPPPIAAPGPARPASSPKSSGIQRTVGWALLGAGVAVAAGGGISHGLSTSDWNRAVELAAEGKDREAFNRAVSDSDSKLVAAGVLYGVGGACALAGVITALTAPSSAEPPAVSVGASAHGRGFSMVLTGRF